MLQMTRQIHTETEDFYTGNEQSQNENKKQFYSKLYEKKYLEINLTTEEG